jgi:protein-tyrosine phosphatase
MLARLGVVRVYDLRTAAERERNPDHLPPGAKPIALDVLAEPGEADPAVIFELLSDPARASRTMADGGMQRFFVASYRDMVHLDSARAAYGTLLRSLATDPGQPALVHCTMGKDRTGWAVAWLLLWLGVRIDVVMREYLSSDAEVRRAFAPVVEDFVARGGDRDVYELMMGVQPSYLDAAIDAMHDAYGSIDAYVSDGLGLSLADQVALKAALLERA